MTSVTKNNNITVAQTSNARNFFNKIICFLFLWGAMLCFTLAETTTIIAPSSDWQYLKGTQEASSPTDSWRNFSFNDSAWSTGNAPFYYGGSTTSGTLLSDMYGGYSSLFMCKTVSLMSGLCENLQLKAFCDDGFVLWINGEEVLRFNVSDGDLSYDGLSASVTSSASWITYDLSSYSNVLKPGEENIFAIQAFNCSFGGSSDFAMDVEISADVTTDTVPPEVQQISPLPGTVIHNPPYITVTFTEPVSGVNRGAMMCQDKVAESFTQINDSVYRFEFPSYNTGDVLSFRWNLNAAIYDQSANKNYFIPPETGWIYTITEDLLKETVVINEFMAINETTLKSRQNEYADWVELYNQTSETIDLSGWYLTDSENNLTRWQFPAGVTISPDSYLIVFCDSSDVSLIYTQLHTNFSLSGDGEYLALVYSDGNTIIHEFSPTYPTQYKDISYGIAGYYPEPTPGEINGVSYLEPVADIVFSEPRGYRPSAFTLTLSTETEDATIYYTLDGTVPSSASTRYTAPLSISSITTLRAIATKAGHLDSSVATRTWLFMDEVLSQPTSTPSGWPSSNSVNNHKLEYGMNSSIIQANKAAVQEGLTNIASISIVTDLANLFDSSTGIYVNPSNDGINWERPVSIELIDPSGGDEFQIEGGLRIRGAYSRSRNNPKHSLRFFFRDMYGGKLNFPLFGNEGASVFDKVDLRTSQNFSWSFESSLYNTFIRETFSRDSQRDFGMPYTRSRYYHLYINGQYWGLYQTQERSDSDYAKTYFGGEGDDWDCIKTSQPGYFTEASDGNMTAFSELYNIAIYQGFAGNYATNYYWIKGLDADGVAIPGSPVYLDEDNLIAYMLITYFARDPDCPVAVNSHANNLYGLYDRVDPTGFKWFKHDGEHSMAANRSYPVITDLTAHGWQLNDLDNFNPMRLHQKLMDHPEYRMHWIDTVQREMLNEDGALSLQNSLFRWNKRQEEINCAIVLESARWGHGRTYDDWITECNYVKDTFIAQSASLLLQNMRDRDWFPQINAPTIQQTGTTEDGDLIFTIYGDAPIYYTLDETDPRLVDDVMNPYALEVAADAFEGETILYKNSQWQYYDEGSMPARNNNASWFQSPYDHSNWKTGTASLGFGDKFVSTSINRYKTNSDEPIVTAYFVTTFDIDNANLIPNLFLNLRADDGAVIYVNGSRVVLHNMKTGYSYSTYAAQDVSGEDENTYYLYEVDPSCLVSGENLIAVELHQSSADSDDLYFDMEAYTTGGQSDNGIQGTIIVPAGSFLKARSWDGTEWSAIAEVDTAIYGDYSDLRVTEMMYAALVPDAVKAQGYSRDDLAWIELQNTGIGILNVEGVKFTSGIDYTFPAARLNAGERLVLVKNLDAFATLYNTNGLFLFSGYSGNLARKGETISIVSPEGDSILSYTYSNTWYPETDQGGAFLVVVDTQAEESLWSTADNWFPSSSLYGTPGNNDTNTEQMIPSIKTQPKNTDAYVDDEVSFSVSVTGTAPIYYQWVKDGYDISGATNALFTITKAKISDTGTYLVRVTNVLGSVISRFVSLNVSIFTWIIPTITQQPVSQTAAVGDSLSFTAYASGTAPITYQWYHNGIALNDATNTTLTLSSITTTDVGDYMVIAKNQVGSAISTTAILSIAGTPILQSGDSIIAIDDESSGYPSNENPPLAIDGSTSTKYLNYGGPNSGFIVTPSVGLSLVNAFRITTANDVEGRDPTSWSIYGTDDAILSTDNSTGLDESWTLIAAGDISLPSERYTASSFITFENDTPYTSYRVIFPTLKNDSVGMMQLSEFQFYGTLWTSGVPMLGESSDHSVFKGEAVSLQATVVGGTLPLYYQWYKDGTLLEGATGQSFTLASATMDDAGSYTVEVQNELGTATSDPYILTVLQMTEDLPLLNWTIDGDTLLFSFTGVLYESDDLINWVPVSATSSYNVLLDEAGQKFYRSVIE